MKRLLPIFVSALILASCGGAEPPLETTPPSPASEPKAANPPAETVTPEMALIQRGAKLYTRCRACHTLDEGGRNKVGPNLWGIYGAKAGVKPGFAYSKAMKSADITWNDTTMDAYLTKPATYLPGTKMSFIGLKKQQDRDAIQAYLKTKTTP